MLSSDVAMTALSESYFADQVTTGNLDEQTVL